jgi:hypothetical protein
MRVYRFYKTWYFDTDTVAKRSWLRLFSTMLRSRSRHNGYRTVHVSIPQILIAGRTVS